MQLNSPDLSVTVDSNKHFDKYINKMVTKLTNVQHLFLYASRIKKLDVLFRAFTIYVPHNVRPIL